LSSFFVAFGEAFFTVALSTTFFAGAALGAAFGVACSTAFFVAVFLAGAFTAAFEATFALVALFVALASFVVFVAVFFGVDMNQPPCSLLLNNNKKIIFTQYLYLEI